VKPHRQRLSRRVELLHWQRRDVAAQFVARRRRRRQLVGRVNVQVQTQVIGAPAAKQISSVARPQQHDGVQHIETEDLRIDSAVRREGAHPL